MNAAPDPDENWHDCPAEEPDCMTCGGEGWCECEDTDSSEGCWVAGCDGLSHRCPNCRGSGLAKDQQYW